MKMFCVGPGIKCQNSKYNMRFLVNIGHVLENVLSDKEIKLYYRSRCCAVIPSSPKVKYCILRITITNVRKFNFFFYY